MAYCYQLAGLIEDLWLAKVRYIVAAGNGDVGREFYYPVAHVVYEDRLRTALQAIVTGIVLSTPGTSNGSLEALVDVYVGVAGYVH